jgi:membrane protein required for colicin V production
VNFVDIVVLAVIALSTLLALSRGFVREVMSVLGWIGAAILTFVVFFYVPQVRAFARAQITEPVIADIIAAVALFTISLFVLGMLNHYISSRVQGSALGPLDKSLGLVFGVVRGVVLVALAYMAMADWLLPNKQDRPDVINQARTEPYVEMAADYIKALVPQDLKDRAGAILDEGSKAVEQSKDLNKTIQQLSPGAQPATPPTTQPAGGSSGDSGQNGGPAAQGSVAGNQDGQGVQYGYKDAERKDLERLIQGQTQ